MEDGHDGRFYWNKEQSSLGSMDMTAWGEILAPVESLVKLPLTAVGPGFHSYTSKSRDLESS